MRILVCGGRDFNNYEAMEDVLKQYEITTLIQGGAKGADALAKKYAKGSNIEMLEYPADWNKYGFAAGPIRNKQMLDEGKPDLILAFPGGKGTANMKEQARIAGIEVLDCF